MASEKLQFTLEIATRQTGDGAAKATQQIGALKTQTDAATEASKRFLTAQEAEVAEVERLVQAARKAAAAREEEAESIREVERAAKAEQAALDVAEAKRRVSERGLKNQSSEFRNLGGFINQAGFQVTDFVVQIQGGTSAITAFSQQFPQLAASAAQAGVSINGSIASVLKSTVSLGTAVSAGAVVIGVGFQQAAVAYQRMSTDLKNAKDAAANFNRNLISAEEQHRQLVQTARQENAAKEYNDAADAAAKLNGELARANELAQAKDGLATAQARASGATGSELATLAVEQFAEQLKRDMAAAVARKTEAQDAFFAQNAVVNSFGPGSDAATVEAEKKKLQEIIKEVADATAAVVNLGQVQEAKIGEAALNATETVGTEAEKKFTEVAEKAKADFAAMKERANGQVDAAAQQASAAIDQILLDNKVTTEELPRLLAAIRQQGQSMVSNTQQAQQVINSNATALETAAAVMAKQDARIKTVEATLKQILGN